MTDRQALADLLAPHCRAILDRVAHEASAAGDPARRLPLGELRQRIDAQAARALAAIALPSPERRRELGSLVGAGRGALDRLTVPKIARIGLARLGFRLARAALEQEVAQRPDADALRREFADFEADLIAALEGATLST